MTPIDLDPFWLSLRVATVATIIGVVVGTPLAWVLARWSFRGKGLISGLLTLPLVLPPTVIGFGLLLLVGRQGWLGHWLESVFGVSVVFHWSGAVLASAVMSAPIFVIPVRAAFAGVDPDFENAARLLGRGEFSVFWSITVPLSWRGFMSGVILAFARALGEFGATLMLAGNIPGRTRTASLAIYDAVLDDNPTLAGVYCFLVASTSLLAILIAQRTQPSSVAR